MKKILSVVIGLMMMTTGIASASTAILNFPTSVCPPDGKEHQLGGYQFFGGVPYVIRAVSVTGDARIQIRTAVSGSLSFDANGNLVFTPSDVPQNTILAEVTGTPSTVIRAFTIEWPAGVSAAAYCINTGSSAVTPTIKVYYEEYE